MDALTSLESAGLTLRWEEVCFSFECSWTPSPKLCLKLFSAPWLSALVHQAVANLTPRREQVCFSVWHCPLYVYCPIRLAVFSYGSLIFRFDSESSISLRVLQALVFRLRAFVLVRVLLSHIN